MFFEFHDGRNGIIKSISIDTSKMDIGVREHLRETLKGKVKFVGDKVIIKTHMTLDDLKALNEGYNTFHSCFILENIFNINPIKLKDTKSEG